MPNTPLVTVPQGTSKPSTSSAGVVSALSIPTFIGAAAIAHKKFGLAVVASLAALALAPSPSSAAVPGDHHFEV